MPGQRDRDYREDLAKQKGFDSYRDHLERLAQGRGFASKNEYRKEMARRKQTKPKNKAVRDLINSKLQEIGKNQAWLARQVGLSRQSISMYAQGKVLPKDNETLGRICSSFGLNEETITKIGLSNFEYL